jgi:hypothetical protein
MRVCKRPTQKEPPFRHKKMAKTQFTPLFPTCGHYRQKKTHGQAGFWEFFFISQGLSATSSPQIPVEKSVENERDMPQT